MRIVVVALAIVLASLGSVRPGVQAAPASPPAVTTATDTSSATTAATPAAPGGCETELAPAPYGADALKRRLAYLTSPELDGRAPGTAGSRAAIAHIARVLGCLGLRPAGDDGGYEQVFVDGDQTTTSNVVGYLAGSDPAVGSEIIVIGAHHDHLGNGYLGANDNASGVTALLAIAQWMTSKGVAPRRTIAFVAFGAEEQGIHGSSYYASHAPTALPMDRVVQYINLDMVGSYRSKRYVAAMGTFARLPARTLLAKLDDRYPKLRVGLGGRARDSDHTPFCTRGIPYVFFWTPDARCYHRTCDTAKNIDVARMSDIAALAGDLAWALASTELDLMVSRTQRGCNGRGK